MTEMVVVTGSVSTRRNADNLIGSVILVRMVVELGIVALVGTALKIALKSTMVTVPMIIVVTTTIVRAPVQRTSVQGTLV